VGERGPRQTGNGDLNLLVVNDRGVFLATLPRAAEVTVGRSSECDLPLGDRNLSRRHAALRFGAHFEVVDLGSLNGTRVGGRALEPQVPATLRGADAILLGSTILMMLRDPSAGSPSSPPSPDAETGAGALSPGPMRSRAATLPATDEVQAVSISPLSPSDDDATWLRRIVASLRTHAGDLGTAASSLGITPATLVERLAAMARPLPAPASEDSGG